MAVGSKWPQGTGWVPSSFGVPQAPGSGATRTAPHLRLDERMPCRLLLSIPSGNFLSFTLWTWVSGPGRASKPWQLWVDLGRESGHTCRGSLGDGEGICAGPAQASQLPSCPISSALPFLSSPCSLVLASGTLHLLPLPGSLFSASSPGSLLAGLEFYHLDVQTASLMSYIFFSDICLYLLGRQGAQPSTCSCHTVHRANTQKEYV